MDSKNVEIAIQGQVKPVVFQKGLAFPGAVVRGVLSHATAHKAVAHRETECK